MMYKNYYKFSTQDKVAFFHKLLILNIYDTNFINLLNF